MKPFYRKGMKLPLVTSRGDILNPNHYVNNHDGSRIDVTILRAVKLSHNRWVLKVTWEGTLFTVPSSAIEYWIVEGNTMLGWTMCPRSYLPCSQNNIGCISLNPGEAEKLFALAKQEGALT